MKYDYLKRFIDVALSVALLFIFLPIVLITAVIIKITSPGPILADTPKRVGKKGKLFFLFKFRSMIPNAYELLKTEPKFRKAYREQQTGGTYKIRDDPRVTPVGRFIRKHSIDEIPQLFNVLRGDMSLVGPRAYYFDELKTQQSKFPETQDLVSQVLSVKPGITGYWQVSGRSEVNFDKRIAMDAYYAREKSFWLDLAIILKTPWVMLTGKGAI